MSLRTQDGVVHKEWTAQVHCRLPLRMMAHSHPIMLGYEIYRERQTFDLDEIILGSSSSLEDNPVFGYQPNINPVS